MKIIIAGAGEIGAYLTKLLCDENHDVVVIDTDEEKLRSIDGHFDALTVHGSVSSIEVLQRANVRKADLFIAVTQLESMNIIAAILGKKLGAKKTTARINNLEYGLAKNRDYFLSLGIDSLIYPEILAAREIVHILKQAGTSKVYEYCSGRLSMFAIKLEENAPILGKTLEDISKDDAVMDYRAVAITRSGTTIIPRGTDIFQANDLVYVITNHSGIASLMKYSGKKTYDIRNMMILGGSRIGKKVAKEIENYSNVKLLELDKEKSFELADFLENTLVINGDGRDIDLLIEEGAKKMDAFVAVTGNSETNILSCLIARKLGVRKVIAEVENLDYIDIADNMGIETIINKKMIAASHIFTYTMNVAVSSVRCITGTDAEIFEFEVKAGAVVTQKTIKNLNFPKEAIIGGIVRGKSNIIATGDCLMKPKDKVVVFALPKAIKQIGRFFN